MKRKTKRFIGASKLASAGFREILRSNIFYRHVRNFFIRNSNALSDGLLATVHHPESIFFSVDSVKTIIKNREEDGLEDMINALYCEWSSVRWGIVVRSKEGSEC